MHARKTGALIRASAVSGAIMGGGSDEQIAAIDGAAGEFGLAFQIVDDILDVEGVAANLGKTAGKDAAAGKPTYPLSTASRRRVAWPPNVSNAPTRPFDPPASTMNVWLRLANGSSTDRTESKAEDQSREPRAAR